MRREAGAAGRDGARRAARGGRDARAPVAPTGARGVGAARRGPGRGGAADVGEGACFAPRELWPSMLVSHWGNTMAKHNRCTTTYDPDRWDVARDPTSRLPLAVAAGDARRGDVAELRATYADCLK